MSDPLGLSSARILLGQFSQKSSYAWYFLLVISIHWPLSCSLAINPLLPTLYSELSLVLHRGLFSSIGIALNKICFYLFNYCPALFFFDMYMCMYVLMYVCIHRATLLIANDCFSRRKTFALWAFKKHHPKLKWVTEANKPLKNLSRESSTQGNF